MLGLNASALRPLARILAALLLGSLPASAHAASAHAASGQDMASTHRALLATYRNLQAVVSTWPAVEASARRLDREFRAACPDAGVGSPQDEPEQRLAYEAAGALWAASYHADAGIARRAIGEVRGLRWSNPALTRRLRRYVRGLREMIALRVPDLCADIRSWTASGYRTIPAGTLRYDAHVEAIDVEVPPPRMFVPYMQPADRSLLARVQHLLTRFEELEFSTGQREWIGLLEVVGLNE